MDLHRIGTGGLLPDLTILLRLDSDDATRRLAERDRGISDRIGGRQRDYHAAVAAAFDRIAAAEPARFVTVDGDGDVEGVQAAVRRAVAPLLEAV